MQLPFRMLSIPAGENGKGDWLKLDLHIHTLDDPKDAVDYSAHQLLERARALGFRVLAITLHDAVFDRQQVFADAAAMGILLIPAAEKSLGSKILMIYDACAHSVGPQFLQSRLIHFMFLAAQSGRAC